MSSCKYILSAFICLFFVGALAVPVSRDKVLEDITAIQEKLDAFAMGLKSYSGITFSELKNVARAYDAWPVEFKREYRKYPGFHLVTDFAINPMKHIELQIEDDKELFARHLKRVENGYKRFRPAYLGQQIGEKKFKIKVVRTMTLFAILAGQDKDTPLTLKHFLNAKAESDIWHDRVEELTTVDDIFASLGELESIFNYFNSPVLKPLFDYIYPSLTPKSSVKELVKLYHEKMWEDQSIKFVNGQATMFKNAGNRSPQTLPSGHEDVINA